jgi:hypothetical protein
VGIALGYGASGFGNPATDQRIPNDARNLKGCRIRAPDIYLSEQAGKQHQANDEALPILECRR